MKKATLFPLSAVRLLPGMLKDRQETNRRYLLELLDPERLLAPWYRQAKLPAPPLYGGWEQRDIAGHSGGHYLSALAATYAATGDPRALERARQFVAGLRRCGETHRDGYAGAVEKSCFEALRRGRISAHNFALNGVWVPLYNLHKTFAGLRDAWRFCRIDDALTIARGLADYLEGVWSHLTPDQMQEVLRCEHGGIAETLIELFEDTGERRHLDLANRAFTQKSALDPLRTGRDELDGMHGNTMIPKVIGLAELYDATGDGNARQAAEFFFDRVVNFRSFANGGNGESEHFFPVGAEAEHLTAFTTETCNSCNMIRLAEHLFEWNPRARVMDYVERTLLNHVAANIGRAPGEFGYFLSMAPVAVKVFSTPCDSFWCCVGTGMESPARYGETFYAHSEEQLWVNHYFPSELDWPEKGLKLTLTGGFPEAECAKLDFRLAAPLRFTLKLRRPGWCSAMKIMVNGEAVSGDCGSDGYPAVERLWRDGDRVSVALPMKYHSEPLPGSDFRAFFRGPTLLAGVLPPTAEKDDPARERFRDHLKARGKTDELPPVLIAEHPVEDPHEAEPAPAVPLDWMPLYRVYEEHYGVYFRMMNQRRHQECEAELLRRAEEEKQLCRETTDEITPGFQQSEVEHDLQEQCSDTGAFQHRKFRRALPGGAFSYRCAVDPAAPMELRLLYWGAEWSSTRIGIFIDETAVAEQETRTLHPGEWVTAACPLPPETTASRKSVRITIRHLAGSDGGRIFHLRMIRKTN